MTKKRKEKERAQKLWEERRDLIRFGYGKIAEFIVREAKQKYQQALLALSKGDVSKAETLLREIVNKIPDAPDPLLALGQLLVETGRFEEAIGILSKACEIDDLNPKAHYWFGRSLEGTMRLRRAKEAYERAMERNPSSEMRKEIMGRLHVVEETLSALPHSSLSDSQAKDFEEALHWAKFYLEVGFPRRAREYLMKAQTIVPDHTQVLKLSEEIKKALSET
ncbi:MAG: tetratricopeptide repeat protein [Armatimonadetes bacterium]|nr:tetratricopeptide repeat protein [Armatimonadota bacterium]